MLQSVKKYIAVLLAAVMVCSVVHITPVWADETENIDSSTITTWTDSSSRLIDFFPDVRVFNAETHAEINFDYTALEVGETYTFLMGFTAFEGEQYFRQNTDGWLTLDLPDNVSVIGTPTAAYPNDATTVFDASTNRIFAIFDNVLAFTTQGAVGINTSMYGGGGLSGAGIGSIGELGFDFGNSTDLSAVYNTSGMVFASQIAYALPSVTVQATEPVYYETLTNVLNDWLTYNIYDFIFTVDLKISNEEVVDFGRGINSAVGFNPFTNIMAMAAAGTSSDLSDFVESVTMWDLSTNPPTEVPAGGTTILGANYRFDILFKETTQLQMGYNDETPGVLTYQLPSDLTIQTAIAKTPLFSPVSGFTGNIIGWFTIDTNGLVKIWFDNVTLEGRPTPNGTNFIDYYSDAQITLSVTAQLTGGDDGNLDFGNGEIITIQPPVRPDPKLTMNKQSLWMPGLYQIGYTITITAIGGAVGNITLIDTPTIATGQTMVNTVQAFGSFMYVVFDADGTPISGFTPLSVQPSSDDSNFSINFGSLVLQENQFITLSYVLDVTKVISNNNGPGGALAGQTQFIHDFQIDNHARVNGIGVLTGNPVPEVSDDTNNPIKKAVIVEKSGQYANSDNSITWEITVGKDATVLLNGATIHDIHTADQISLAASDIHITFYDNYGRILWQGDGTTFLSANPGKLTLRDGGSDRIDDSFDLIVPSTYGDVYKVYLEYKTNVLLQSPSPGEAPGGLVTNNVTITFPDGSPGPGAGGEVLIVGDRIAVTKTSGGICGQPETTGRPINDPQTPMSRGPNGERYWIDYTINVAIPAGLQNQRIWIRDSIYGNNNTLPASINNPDRFTINATDTNGNTLITLLQYTQPAISGNSWSVFFGGGTDANTTTWQYAVAVNLTINYRIWIPDAWVDVLSSGYNNFANLVEIYNGVWNGSAYQVGSTNSDWETWPLSKSATPTSNPALFNYVVKINGAYTGNNGGRTSLMMTNHRPTFTDTFATEMEYVPGSFYVFDGTTRFAPAADVTVSGNVLSVMLNPLDQAWNIIDENGNVTGTAPANWFAQRKTYEFRYQMQIKAQYLNADQGPLNNTARLTVNPGECAFENDANVSYVFKPVSKTMNPVAPGSSRLRVEIIINPTGAFHYPEDGSLAPGLVAVSDYLANVSMFMDSIEIYTQSNVNGIWNGNWDQDMTGNITFNTNQKWSANVIAPPTPPQGVPADNQVNFIIPNDTPIKIVYYVQVSLLPGETGNLSNAVYVGGKDASDGEDNYVISDGGAGITASRIDFRVFKKDTVTGANLEGATFRLFVTSIQDGYIPPGNLPIGTSVTTPTGQIMKFALVGGPETTDVNGVALFSGSEWITQSYKLLFMLEETKTPGGYTATDNDGRIFFTLNPALTAADLNEINTLLGSLGPSNQASDNLTVFNDPTVQPPDVPASVRFIKRFEGLMPWQISQYLANFILEVVDPKGVVHQFTLSQLLSGPVYIEDAVSGTYLIREINASVPGYTLVTSPPLPMRTNIDVVQHGAVTLTITNSYFPDVVVPPPDIDVPFIPSFPRPPVPPITPPTVPPITPGIPPIVPEIPNIELPPITPPPWPIEPSPPIDPGWPGVPPDWPPAGPPPWEPHPEIPHDPIYIVDDDGNPLGHWEHGDDGWTYIPDPNVPTGSISPQTSDTRSVIGYTIIMLAGLALMMGALKVKRVRQHTKH